MFVSSCGASSMLESTRLDRRTIGMVAVVGCILLALADLVHVPLFGLHQDVNVSLYMLRGKTQPPSEVPRCDGFDQSRYNGVVHASIIEVHELVRGGAFIEAVGICSGCRG